MGAKSSKTYVKAISIIMIIVAVFASIYILVYGHRTRDRLAPTREGGRRVEIAHGERKEGVIRLTKANCEKTQGAKKQGKSSPTTTREPERKPQGLSRKLMGYVAALSDPGISAVERNHIEHELGSLQDRALDETIRTMLEDGLLDLADKSGTGIERLVSAIRIAGLRSDTASVNSIIQICSHPEATEEMRMAAYEALGYMRTAEAKVFLREELSHEQDGFVLSQIVLSLGIAGDSESSSRFLEYLKSPDPDLRDSAIIALGSIKEERAVPEFKKIYGNSADSSKVLILQALKDIGNSGASALIQQLAKRE